MDATEFNNLQEALLYALLPAAHWLITLLVALGLFSGFLSIWMALLRWLSKRR